MKIYFDGVQIDNSAITSLHQEGSLFADSFKLGSTVCRVVRMSVLKDYVISHPTSVVIKDDDNTTRFTLQIDSISDTNIDFYDYVLVDKMVNLNQVYNFSALATPNVQNVLNDICTILLNCPAPMISYGNDITISYSSDVTARDIVSWIAEINASFARIDETGNLVFVKFENGLNTPGINVDQCADFKLGEYHKIERVYLELATGTAYYPSNYSGQHNTVYLNPYNQLFSDSGNYTISGMVEHVYDEIFGFEFYSIETSRSSIIQDALPGDLVKFSLDGTDYPTIIQADWDYNSQWIGGYTCMIETKQQQETSVISNPVLNNIKIIVDRETGTITQQINQMQGDLNQATSSFEQTANSLEVRVSNTESGLSDAEGRLTNYETVVNIQADGVRISQGTTGAYVMFTATGMQIYVEGLKTAWAEADGFSAYELMIGGPEETTKWHLHEANNGATLMFLRS